MATTLTLVLLALCAYLIGSIPFGLLLTKFAGLGDIRTIGSGNIGATNVLRTGNKKLAALTLFLDGAKGAAVIFLAHALLLTQVTDNQKFGGLPNEDLISPGYSMNAILFALGGIAIIGHIFPVWLKFKGGKGVATFFGMMLAFDVTIGVAGLATWLLAAYISKRSSVGALVATAAVPFYMAADVFRMHIHWYDARHLTMTSFIPATICAALVVLIWYKHKDNIKRILNGTEPKIGKKAA